MSHVQLPTDSPRSHQIWPIFWASKASIIYFLNLHILRTLCGMKITVSPRPAFNLSVKRNKNILFYFQQQLTHFLASQFKEEWLLFWFLTFAIICFIVFIFLYFGDTINHKEKVYMEINNFRMPSMDSKKVCLSCLYLSAIPTFCVEG